LKQLSLQKILLFHWSLQQISAVSVWNKTRKKETKKQTIKQTKKHQEEKRKIRLKTQKLQNLRALFCIAVVFKLCVEEDEGSAKTCGGHAEHFVETGVNFTAYNK
jgi:hypothetical protein